MNIEILLQTGVDYEKIDHILGWYLGLTIRRYRTSGTIAALNFGCLKKLNAIYITAFTILKISEKTVAFPFEQMYTNTVVFRNNTNSN